MSFFVFISFHRLSFCIHFLSCFLLFCIHFLSFCFHVLSCSVCSVASYQRYRSSNTDMLKPVRWVSAQTLALFHMSLSILLSFSYRLEACAGCHLQASWTCTCISLLSFFYSYHFLGWQCVGSVKVQAKLKWNAQGYYTIPIVFDQHNREGFKQQDMRIFNM